MSYKVDTLKNEIKERKHELKETRRRETRENLERAGDRVRDFFDDVKYYITNPFVAFFLITSISLVGLSTWFGVSAAKNKKAAPMVGEKFQESLLNYLAKANKVNRTANVSILSAKVDKINGDVYAQICVEENGVKTNKFMLIETNLSELIEFSGLTSDKTENRKTFENLDSLKIYDCKELSSLSNSMDENQYNDFCENIIRESKLSNSRVLNATEYGSNGNKNESEVIILSAYEEKIYFATFNKETDEVKITKEEEYEDWKYHFEQLERNMEDYFEDESSQSEVVKFELTVPEGATSSNKATRNVVKQHNGTFDFTSAEFNQ